MFRLCRATMVALSLFAATLVVPASPASAASCSARSSGTVTGGYYARYWCTSVLFVDGFGSTLTDANLEALNLYQLYVDYGLDCEGRSTGTVTGGYRAQLWCSSILFVEGYGSSLTDAAYEARALAKLYAEKGRDCDTRSSRRISGGYEVTLWCSGLLFVDGRGSTLTGAAQVARLAATVG